MKRCRGCRKIIIGSAVAGSDGGKYHQECALRANAITMQDPLPEEIRRSTTKCWRCGAENDASDDYCTSCASPLADPRNGSRHGRDRGEITIIALRNIARALVKSLVLSGILIGLIAAIVGIIDIMAGRRLLTGFGIVLAAAGVVLALSSVTAISRTRERIDLAMRPMMRNTFTLLWGHWKSGPSKHKDNLSLVLIMTGLTVFIVGLFLV